MMSNFIKSPLAVERFLVCRDEEERRLIEEEVNAITGLLTRGLISDKQYDICMKVILFKAVKSEVVEEMTSKCDKYMREGGSASAIISMPRRQRQHDVQLQGLAGTGVCEGYVRGVVERLNESCAETSFNVSSCSSYCCDSPSGQVQQSKVRRAVIGERISRLRRVFES